VRNTKEKKIQKKTKTHHIDVFYCQRNIKMSKNTWQLHVFFSNYILF
jgi:hypothetical protein